jgi:hypothetical protein
LAFAYPPWLLTDCAESMPGNEMIMRYIRCENE